MRAVAEVTVGDAHPTARLLDKVDIAFKPGGGNPTSKVPVKADPFVGLDASAREAQFWDSVADAGAVSVLNLQGNANSAAMLRFLGGVSGKRVLDICCGTGGTTIALDRLGAAAVVGCDVSSASIQVARDLAARCGSTAVFVEGPVEAFRREWVDGFDAIVGTYALHHLNLAACLPHLSAYLRPGGRAAFLETSGLNPFLAWARRHLTGRFGIPRYGTVDERPLTSGDIEAIAVAFGTCRVTAPGYDVLQILDRQIFHYRHARITKVFAAVDAGLARIWPSGSYHVVLECGPQSAGGPNGNRSWQ